MSGEWIRNTARTVLTRAVRGRAERGSPWGEAVLAEFDQTTGAWGALRWMAGGIRVAWRERTAARSPVSPRIRGARRVTLAVVATAGIALLANQYVLTVHYVPSGSMQPTVAIGDDGDHIKDNDDRFQTVRRLIGLPGDHIECHDGKVFRNGDVLDEPYLEDETSTECSPTTVADGSVYGLGDWRTGSVDSRIRPVRQADVVGRVLTL